jgi:hypothetical protein
MTSESGPQPTLSQTVASFFHDALLDEDRSELVPPDHPEAIRIEGTIYDGAGEPVSDAMVEIWQANGADTTTPQMTERTGRSTRVSPASDAPEPMPAAGSPS